MRPPFYTVGKSVGNNYIYAQQIRLIETAQTIKIPIAQNTEWKVYVGIGAVSAIAVAAGSLYLKKKL